MIEEYDDSTWDYIHTDVNEATLTFSYDTDDFTLTSSSVWTSGSGGQGHSFSTRDQALSVVRDSVNVDDFDPLREFSIYNRGTRHDQINGSGGSILMQWNDFTSGSFSSAPAADLVEPHSSSRLSASSLTILIVFTPFRHKQNLRPA